jgi:periplasmic protein TonB
MSDRYIEKTFLYLLTLSVLLHLAIFGLVALIPPEKVKSAQEPTMVDLTELPEPPPAPPGPKPENRRSAERPHRVTREMAPKGTRETERLVPQPARPTEPSRAETRPEPATPSRKEQPGRTPQVTEAPITRGEGIFKPKTGETGGDRTRLFPSAGKMARLEESYRKKYGPEVEDGETKFLNTDDIQFGSFLRRFETAVYGVWHYPQAALLRGIEGVTPVKITFNRGGEIVHVELLESSGSKILDDEVIRTLKQIGPVGSFPKGYTGQAFNLIAFFQYGITGGRLH